MSRDIDYAAVAVKTAIVEKFGKLNVLDALDVRANEKTISVQDGKRKIAGTRDDLLAALRRAANYDELFTGPRAAS